MKKAILVFVSFLALGNLFAQTFNCDSLTREFDTQIAKAKKEGLDKAIIQQLQSTKEQLLQAFCNTATTNKPPTAASVNNSLSTPNNNSKKSVTKNFTSAYKITLKVTAEQNSNLTQLYSYYLTHTGNAILIDDNCLPSSSNYRESFAENGSLDGWLMESNGNSTVFTTSAEQGKMAIAVPNVNFLNLQHSKENKPTIKALGKTKTIAGYACKAYAVSTTENGEAVNLTCWVTNAPLPFNHASFPFFTMFSASAIGIPVNPKQAVLLIEGTTGKEKIYVEVSSIQPLVKNYAFSNYKALY
jgi:hypothetical protein